MQTLLLNHISNRYHRVWRFIGTYRTQHWQQKSHCENRSLLSLQNLSLPLTWYFCPLDTRAYCFMSEANFFTNWCIIIPSSLFSLFRTGPQNFAWSIFIYNLMALHPTRNMHGFKMLINGAASQFVVFIKVIFPRKSSRMISYMLKGLRLREDFFVLLYTVTSVQSTQQEIAVAHVPVACFFIHL